MADLVLLRHGQSEWNALNLFTGWVDVDLSREGEDEARRAGALLAAEPGLDPAVVHTSVLTRAVRTADLALDELGRTWLPVRRHWRLNERHYGALQGLDKKATADRFGDEQVRLWRRSYDVPPPELEAGGPPAGAGASPEERGRADLSTDPRYALVPPSALPRRECLADVVRRVVPYWEDAIVPDLATFGSVLVVAHGNSLRALVKYLLDVPDDVIPGLEIPTGVPWHFTLDRRFAVEEEHKLGDPEAIAAAQEATRHQAG